MHRSPRSSSSLSRSLFSAPDSADATAAAGATRSKVSVPNRAFALATAVATLSLMVALASAPMPAAAADSRAGEIGNKAVDVVLLRPGGFFRTLVGGLFMVPMSVFNLAALPFQGTAVYAESAEVLILEPFRYTFRRPLGEDLEGE